MAAAAKKQDMPPPGGFKSLNYSRIPAKTLIGGKTLIGVSLVATGAALYHYTLVHRRIEREDIELRSSIFAITPLLLAEQDREYLKQLRRNRDAEEKLMENVEGWEVGKYKGERIFKTVSEDFLVKPSANEYFAHNHPKWYQTFKNLHLWE